MKNKYSDEKLDKMLTKLLNSEIPENMQFQEQLSPEINAVVKQSIWYNRRRVFNIGAVCAAVICLVFPVYYLMNSSELITDSNGSALSETVSGDELQEKFDLFNSELGRYNFVKVKLESSSFYRKFSETPYIENGSTPETAVLLALNLIPYDAIETDECELYIRIIKNGNRIIYTRQAYIIGYDKKGRINCILNTSEKFSEDEEKIIECSEIFKGIKSAQQGFENILSKFQRKDSVVKIDGQEIRDMIDTETEQNLSTVNAYACVKDGESFIPLSIYELDYKVAEKLNQNKEIPDFIKINYSGGETSFFTTLIYDCSKVNSIRINTVKTDDLWENIG